MLYTIYQSKQWGLIVNVFQVSSSCNTISFPFVVSKLHLKHYTKKGNAQRRKTMKVCDEPRSIFFKLWYNHCQFLCIILFSFHKAIANWIKRWIITQQSNFLCQVFGFTIECYLHCYFRTFWHLITRERKVIWFFFFLKLAIYYMLNLSFT